MEFNLVKKHFNIKFNKDSIMFVSLFDNMDFEYLVNNPIHRYKDYPEVYNFLFECKYLYESEIAKIKNGNLIIANNDFMELPDDEKYKLVLKKPINFAMKIKDRGIVGQDNFHFQYKILDEKYENIEIIGISGILNNQYYLLNKNLYHLFRAITLINNISNSDDNKQSRIWALINEIKKESEFTNSVLTGFFNNEKIIIPSKMTFDIKEDKEHNLELLANLSDLDAEQQNEFKENFNKLIDVQDTYSFNLNGTKIRIVMTPEIKENFKTIKATPKKIRRKKDQDEILKNPTGIFKNPEVLSLDNFSDRVIDFGLYKSVVNSSSCSDIPWGYPILKELIDISGQNIFIKLNSKEDSDLLSDLVTDAVNNEFSSIYFQDYTIPLSTTNLQVLKYFCHKFNGTKEEKKENFKIVVLKNVNNEAIEVKVTDDLIEELKEQVQKIRKDNVAIYQNNNDTNTNNKLDTITINNEKIPLTVENIKPITKILEIHLIIEEDNNEIKVLNESLMKTYCNNMTLEIPVELKKQIKTVDNRIIDVELKNHQKKGLAWLQNSYKMRDIGRNGVLLADDMGLGKTLQILSFMFWLKNVEKNNFNNSMNNKPILLVAPVILLENWKNEYHNFFESTLGEPLILHGDKLKSLRNDDGTFTGREYYQITDNIGAPKAYLNTSEIKKYNIVITNYDTIVNYEYSLGSIDWSVIILDEAQEIKEEKSYKSRIIKSLKADFKIACTGTPVENKLTDLWNIFNFLQPDLLGAKNEFSKEFNEKTMDDEKYVQLQDKFYYQKPYAYILRRMKSIELKDSLPEKYIKTYKIPLSERQVEIYGKLKSEMLTKPSIEVLTKMNKFSQHPRLLEDDTTHSCNVLIQESPKLQKLIEILKVIKEKNEKVLIFCLFHELQKYLKIVLEDVFDLNDIMIINGESNGTGNRQKMIDAFQQNHDEFNIMILSPIAAGVGLNIIGANHVVHYGRWWNPAKENQATDRVYRINQMRDVYVHYLIDTLPNSDEKTFDENLHDLITSKIELANNFLKPNNIDLREILINEIGK